MERELNILKQRFLEGKASLQEGLLVYKLPDCLIQKGIFWEVQHFNWRQKQTYPMEGKLPNYSIYYIMVCWCTHPQVLRRSHGMAKPTGIS